MNTVRCVLYTLLIKKAERLGSLEEIKTAQTITRHIIDNVDGDLLSVEMQRRYFKMLFERYKDKLSYPVKAGGVCTTILELLSDNKRRWKLISEKKTSCMTVAPSQGAWIQFYLPLDCKTISRVQQKATQ